MATTDALPAVVESNATFDDNADAPLTVNAAALNLTKEQMIAFMNLVKHGKMSIDEAIARAKTISDKQDTVEKEDRYLVKSFGEQMDILSTLPIAIKQSVTRKMREDKLAFDEALAQVLEANYGKSKRRSSVSATATTSTSPSPSSSSSTSLRERMSSFRLRRRSTSDAIDAPTSGSERPRRGLLRRKSTSEMERGVPVSDELNQDMAEASNLLAQLKMVKKKEQG